jgi:LAS superfamily LD-carboxypeptidase LdcB
VMSISAAPAKVASAQTDPIEGNTVPNISESSVTIPIKLEPVVEREVDFQPAPQDQNDDAMISKTAGEISSVVFDEPSMYDIYVGKNEAKQRTPLGNAPCKLTQAAKIEDIQSSFRGKALRNRYDNGAYVEGERAAIIALANLLQAASEENYQLMNIRSGYRSFDTQTLITQSAALPVGIDLAAPGHSEHQLGTTFDLGWGKLSLSYREITANQEASRFYAWLRDHARDFGFVISYPYKSIGKDTNIQMPFITEYVAEPWHIRYVTKPFAYSIWSFKDAGGKNYLDPASQLTPADFYRSATSGACSSEDR